MSTPPQPSCPIQRLIIFHKCLPETCGVPLGESAELFELCEQILVYYPSSSQEKAVQFMGLCNALHSLPDSLNVQEEDDPTKEIEIYFDNSTLVFTEVEPDVLAVLQVSRFGKQNANSGGGNALAIRTFMQNSYLLYKLFRGGGILNRLKQTSPGIITSSACLFPGMDQLYTLQKQLRKTPHENQKEELLKKIDFLKQNLPIKKVRQSLNIWYKEYLSNLAFISTRNGGGLRCLVECTPIPIIRYSRQYVSEKKQTFLETQVKAFLQEIHGPQLLGISTFGVGQFLYSHSACDSKIIDNKTATVVMGYLISYRNKVIKSYSSSSSSPAQTPPLLKLRDYWTQSFRASQSNAGASSFENSSQIQQQQPQSYFLCPPPPYMLNSDDDDDQCTQDCFEISHQRIWAPTVHIPTQEQDFAQASFQKIRVILLEVQDFSFLLYINHGTTTLSNDLLANFLQTAQDRLSRAVKNTLLASERPQKMAQPNGVDLILIDRPKDRLAFLSSSDHDHRAVDYSRAAENQKNNEKAPSLSFLGFRDAHRSQQQNEQSISTTSAIHNNTIEWSSSLGLDSRHLLASRLHLDVLLAFDDMANEIHSAKEDLELCTCMTLGWVYASSFCQGIEMYAFLDSSIHVTVADVQQVVREIKEQYLPVSNG